MNKYVGSRKVPVSSIVPIVRDTRGPRRMCSMEYPMIESGRGVQWGGDRIPHFTSCHGTGVRI